MIRYVLTLCFGMPEAKSKAAKQLAKQFDSRLRSLADWMTTLGDCEVTLTPDHAQEVVALLRDARKHGGRVNSPWIWEELVDDGQDRAEWYLVDPRYDGDFEGMSWDLQEPLEDEDELIGVKADRMKPGFHVAGWEPLVYVSERFKQVVEANQLTGVEFIWCRDVGKCAAMQWFLPVCRAGLGRGVDNPWIDAKKFDGKGFQTLDPRGRHGQRSAFENQYRPGAGLEVPVLKDLLPLLKSMEVLKRPARIRGAPRFLRKYLPQTDFAYTIHDIGGDRGSNMRQRGLALSRRARDLLVANRLAGPKELIPVLILDKPPKGVEDLDRRYGPAESAFTAEQLAKLREISAAAWARHAAHPKPPRKPDLARSLSLLRGRRKRAARQFAKPAAPQAIAGAAMALGREIPAAWQKILRATNGGRITKCAIADGEACLIVPVEKLAETRKDDAVYYRGMGAKMPASLVVVAQTEIGDSLWLDTAKVTPEGDCNVILMSHETGDEERRWPTVAEFLEELLTDTVED